MKRFLLALFLFACCEVRTHGQIRNLPYLDQKHLVARSKALSSSLFLSDNVLVTSSLAGDAQGAIQLWNLQTCECTANLTSQPAGVFSVALSGDQKLFASGGDGLVVVHQISGGKAVSRISLPPGRILGLTFALSGTLLFAAGENRHIHVVDIVTGKLTGSIPAHDETVTTLAITRDGKRLISGSFDGTVKLWDIASLKLERKLTGNGGRVHGVAVSPDGKSLAAACASSTEGEARRAEVALWNLENTKQRKSLHDGSAGFTCVQFSPDGSLIAAGHADGWIASWSKDGVLCARLEADAHWITSLHFAPDGRSVVTTSWDSEARIWDLPIWKPAIAIPVQFSCSGTLAYDPHTRLVLVGGNDKSIRAFDPASKRVGREFQAKSDSTMALAVSPNGKWLAAGSGRQEVAPQLVRAVRVGAIPQPPTAKQEMITLLELSSGKELRTLAGHTGPVHALAFSPNAEVLASGSADKTARLWNMATGTEQAQLIGHAAPVSCLAFHPDGNTLASASDDGSVRLWNVQLGHEKSSFQAHAGGLSGLVYSPDGRWLATSCVLERNVSIAVWDADTGECRWKVTYPGVYSTGLAFSPDGKRVFALSGAGWDSGMVAVIEAESGRRRIDLLGGTSRLLSCCLSGDGKSLFASTLATNDKNELWHWTLPESVSR